MNFSNDIKYIGVDDHDIDLFEGQYAVPNGMAYNSYLIIDDKIAVIDTVDAKFSNQWLDNIENTLNGRIPNYLIVQHMEPDHSANIVEFIKKYPETTVVASSKAFDMMKNFFGTDFSDKRICVEENDTLSLGKHVLTFISAPMVHWPEVIVTYDSFDKVLFSADGFGKFGALDTNEEWSCEARRYYIGIVGKYGDQVQNLLNKASNLDIKTICPLHGPVLTENLGYYIDLYKTWSSFKPEEEGVVIAYTSVYGNTKKAVFKLADNLRNNGYSKIIIHDLARCDMSEAVEDAFRYNKLVLATTTYNAEIFPFMREFINELTERNFSNRIVAFIENGSWAPSAANIMRSMLKNSKNLIYTKTTVNILSTLNQKSAAQLDELSKELCKDYILCQDSKKDSVSNKNIASALSHIEYGLYLVTSNNGKKDNGLIINTVTQVTDSPNRIAVTINKENYSYHIIKDTGIMNINCLTVDAPLSLFKNFGFVSGKDIDKFENCESLSLERSNNGLIVLLKYINAVLSLKVEQYVDLDTHGMFICCVTDSCVISDRPTMSYADYKKNIKPSGEIKNTNNTNNTNKYVCNICGYVYEDSYLPDDFVCPLCKHGISAFEKI